MVLDLGSVLSKVHEYRLQRESDAIRIEVHEIILGSDAKFVAVPVQAIGGSTNNPDFHMQGNEEFKVLENLIEKIQTLSKDEIFPSK